MRPTLNITVLAALATQVAAAGAHGGYRSRCSLVHLAFQPSSKDYGTLMATCTDSGGNDYHTKLDLNLCLRNNNGQLKWGER
jgi:hypothetical protein